MTTQEILQGVHDWTNGKIVYDISVAHPDGQGNPTPYTDLTAALGNGGANIPEPLRKGGMSVKFIKGSAQSSDNKYVQYRLLTDAFSTTVDDWEQAASVAQLEELEDNLRCDIVVNAEFYKRKTGGTQSVGSGIAAIKEVRGKSIVWNQLVSHSSAKTTTKNGVTNIGNGDGTYTIYTDEAGASAQTYFNVNTINNIISGHKYYIKGCPAGGSASTYMTLAYSSRIIGADYGGGFIAVAKSSGIDYVAIVVQNGTVITTPIVFNPQWFDLTLMFGAGNEPATVADFEKMFPLDYYDYNKGEVIPFAGQNLTTTGKNQYNHATGKANLLGGQTYQIGGTYTGATIDGVAVTLDSNNCFTATKDCVLDVTGGNDTDTFVGLYNGETNTFEPYEKHTLPLDPSQWRDKNGDLVFPYGGMHGIGSAYDYAKVDADGYIHKAVRVFERRAYESGDTELTNVITDGSTYTFYPLAEPIEVELSTPVYAKYLVDKDGTEEITPANGTVPYTTMANLTILYAIDAPSEIKNLPKNYLSKESAENMLNALVSARVITGYTMTWDAANNRYAFTFTK